ncbi:hypothetical protein [Conexibacter arvalis]|uniref:Secreted protein n=1 Tax=Conexibacter arvalis TaxID=912552 RepID=A0A840I6K9_9ACTN|nr:hypothetical protein [Conexibacter arvalis]MBB4660487.1 hypothetical protein [Conexibacter arvalis]
MSIPTRLATLLAAVVMLAAGAATASAALIPLNVNPAGQSVAASVGPVSFTTLGTGVVITCQPSSITKDVIANGSGTVAVGNAVYNNCVGPAGIPMTATNPAQWTLQVVGELLETPDRMLLVGLDFTIPAGGLRFTSAPPGVCSFTVSGSFTLGKLFPPQALPITQAVTPLDQFIVLPLPKQTLTVANAACLGVVVNGDRLEKRGTYTLNRAYTASQR